MSKQLFYLVEVAGKDYPVAFSNLAMAHYARGAGVPLAELETALVNIDLLGTFELTYYALREGARLARQKCAFESIEAVADFETLHPGAITSFLGILSEQAAADEEAEPEPAKKGAKKKTSRQRS